MNNEKLKKMLHAAEPSASSRVAKSEPRIDRWQLILLPTYPCNHVKEQQENLYRANAPSAWNV